MLTSCILFFASLITVQANPTCLRRGTPHSLQTDMYLVYRDVLENASLLQCTPSLTNQSECDSEAVNSTCKNSTGSLICKVDSLFMDPYQFLFQLRESSTDKVLSSSIMEVSNKTCQCENVTLDLRNVQLSIDFLVNSTKANIAWRSTPDRTHAVQYFAYNSTKGSKCKNDNYIERSVCDLSNENLCKKYTIVIETSYFLCRNYSQETLKTFELTPIEPDKVTYTCVVKESSIDVYIHNQRHEWTYTYFMKTQSGRSPGRILNSSDLKINLVGHPSKYTKLYLQACNQCNKCGEFSMKNCEFHAKPGPVPKSFNMLEIAVGSTIGLVVIIIAIIVFWAYRNNKLCCTQPTEENTSDEVFEIESNRLIQPRYHS